jgi:hypothetical protein
MLIATYGSQEFWQAGDQVYRVQTGNHGWLTDSGIPANARWECSRIHFDRFRAVFEAAA